MPSPTKTGGHPTGWDSNSVAASASETSGWIDFSTSYGGTLNIKITNGTISPSAAGNGIQMIHATKSTGTPEEFNFGGQLRAGLQASASYQWGGIDIPIGVKFIKIKMDNNDCNRAVTVKVKWTKVTSMS